MRSMDTSVLARPAAALALLVGSAIALPAHAQESGPGSPPEQPPAPEGILPIPDYTGDIWTRRALLGDLNGARTDLAEAGIQFGIDWSNTFQSVVTGGRDPGGAIGGALDFNLSLDLMRMGLVPGAVVKMRGESRYGESVNTDAGPLLPVSTDMFLPLASGGADQSIPFTLTTLSYTQFLSESFGLFIGKFDTFDGDPNEFASGRGLTQFQNLNFIFTPSPLLTVPYSTLGAGFFVAPTRDISVSATIMNTSDSSTTTGFDDFGEGWTVAAEAQFQHRLGHLPGGFNVGGSYAWDNDFATIGRRFVFNPGEGVTPSPGEDDSWAMYVSGWQYVFVEDPAAVKNQPVNLLDGAPDHQGVGLFARFSFADQDTNPVEWSASFGVGGRGIIPGRDNDLFGLGYYYIEAQQTRLATVLAADDSNQGFEAFYNIALTPAAGLTFDAQIVEPVSDARDTAVVLGMRLVLRF